MLVYNKEAIEVCQRRGNDGIYSLLLHPRLHWQFVVQDLQHYGCDWLFDVSNLKQYVPDSLLSVHETYSRPAKFHALVISTT